MYLLSTATAVVLFNVAFWAGDAGVPVFPFLIAGAILAFFAGGYAWPPIANRGAWEEACRYRDWSVSTTRVTYTVTTVATFGIIVSAAAFMVLA
jgi:hypothetical protein